MSRTSTQTFTGAAHLRHRLVLSILSSHPLRLRSIRADDTTPGLSPAEVSFIRLLDKLTSGTVIEINETGTSLFYKPGILLGAHHLTHECHPSRPVSYYLYPLLMLAPFCKRPLTLTLRGPTHAPSDYSADTLAAVSVPLLRRLTLGASLEPRVDVRKRAVCSKGANGGGRGGVLTFSCGVLTAKLRPVDLLQPGYVKRIRGTAFANRTSPGLVARMVDTTRGAMNPLLPDVYVHTDVANGKDCGVGFALQLVAETTEGCLLGADWTASSAGVTPEAVASDACNMLLEEVAAAGCVDSGHACLAALYCALADSDVSRIRVGRLSEATVQFLRDLKRFFGVVFKVKVDGDADGEGAAEGGIVLSCVGVGLSNVARQRF
ncbi:unnamed protein product [Chondrus crispus]|uniref:RNA 3'-terminal phosphate cyclase-like protein n=1 Tax=Chondrus crispus TaxID=2769 RepID=R7QB35_CHOCR|nr:unnamed protein product [Chondrus crispus]CDF35284.1 unnamed protein product [Chondrus crispus]|eukprot:XP_005715103.1 unnamed protein product [Chondrus crispus]